MAIGYIMYTPKEALHPGDVVDNFLSNAGNLPGSAANDKRLHDLYTEQNRTVPSLIITESMTIDDFIRWILDFPLGTKTINTYQGTSNIILFGENGNFNIALIKRNNVEVTGLAVNHWNANVFSFAINSSAETIFSYKKLS